jgi:hypothetical protein
MGRWVPPPARAGRRGSRGQDHGPRRCPRCGTGDLFDIAVGARQGAVRHAAYCAGVYDRQRRRFLARSCGYSEGSVAAATTGDGLARLEPEKTTDTIAVVQTIGGGAPHAVEPAS